MMARASFLGEQKPGNPLVEYHLGMDFGVRHDFTTLIGLVRTQYWDFSQIDHFQRPMRKTRPDAFHVNMIMRYPTDWDNVDEVLPDVNRRIGLLKERDEASGLRIALDFNGVGDGPVREMIKNNPHNVDVSPVYITGGAMERVNNEQPSFAFTNVPRINLLDVGQRGMRVGLGPKDDRKPVRISSQLKDDPLIEILLREMRAVDPRMPVGTKADDDLSLWREKEHDDLVFAFCLASWAADKGYHFPVVVDLSRVV